MLSRAPVLVFALDAEGVCTLSEGAALDLIGLTPGEVVGRNMLEMYAAEAETLQTLRRALSGETFRSEYHIAGGPCLDTYWMPVFEGDRVSGAIGISLDVTDRVRAQEQMALYRAFVEAAPQFIAMADLDGTMRYVNPGGRHMVGMPEEVDVAGTTISDYLTAEGVELSERVEQPAVLEHGAYEGENTLRHWSTGRGIPVRLASFLLRDPVTGEPSGFATVQADISEVVAAREAMEQALDYQRGLLLHLHEAQEAERQRIAGEVHDDTIQVLAAVNLRLHALRRRLSAQSAGPEVFAAIEGLDESVRSATSRLRAMLVELDPPSLREVSLEQLVRQQAETVLSDAGVELAVEILVEEQPTEAVGRILLRIAQEALTNVRKHADAQRVELSVVQRDGHYHLRVRDDGVGLFARSADARHLGLRSMSDRAESVGGWCAVGPGPGGGTLVEAVVPVRLGHHHVQEPGLSLRIFLEQAMESITDAYVAIDKQWRYVYMNSAGYRLFGRDPADSVVGKVIWEEFDVAPEFEQAYRRAQAEQVPVEFRAYYGPWDRWVENRIVPTSAGLSIFARDVSEEVRLVEQSAAQAELIQTGRDIIALLTGPLGAKEALVAAAERVVHGWGLEGLRILAEDRTGGLDLSVGRTDGRVSDIVVLNTGGRRIGEIQAFGDTGLLDEDILRLFAIRVVGD